MPVPVDPLHLQGSNELIRRYDVRASMGFDSVFCLYIVRIYAGKSIPINAIGL